MALSFKYSFKKEAEKPRHILVRVQTKSSSAVAPGSFSFFSIKNSQEYGRGAARDRRAIAFRRANALDPRLAPVLRDQQEDPPWGGPTRDDSQRRSMT
jgi:hypothetical protein